MIWCNECRCYHEPGCHDPMWLVWCDDYGGSVHDARKLRASTPEEAAEKWAEYEDAQSADYLIVGGSDAIVSVTSDSRYEETRFIVTGESVPEYHAKIVDDER